MPRVIIHTGGSELVQEFTPGAWLAEVILAAGVLFDRPCAGRGSCGKCRMQVQGQVSEPSAAERKHLTAEQLAGGLRLVCQTRAWGEVEVWTGAAAVFTDKIFQARADYSELRGEPGLAIDLGSTTVAALLVEAETGRPWAGHAVLNRQVSQGAEVLSRLARAEQEPELLSRLAQESIQEALSGLRLPAELGRRLRRVVVVGNSAMHHLLLGLPVQTLARAPFAPAAKEARRGTGTLLGPSVPEAWQVWFPPLIGGFVGSDALACLLFFGLDRADQPAAALDLGTNGEVLVSDGRRIVAASTAAGPAFEGVNIACGMRALPGAIVRAGVERGALRLETLGGQPAAGIAGSGLISLACSLVRLGAIAANGNLVAAGELRLEGAGREKKLWLTDTVYLSQHDVRELQKAKAAIRAALDSLLEKLSLAPSDLRRVILTGSFGGRVVVEDALEIGLLPQLDPLRVACLPNGAGLGAALLLREDNFARAEELALQVGHVELNLLPAFQERFIRALSF